MPPTIRRSARQDSPIAKQIQVLTADNLSALPNLIHGFSTRSGGLSAAYGGAQLNLGFTPSDARETTQRNRRLFVQHATGRLRSLPPLITLRQIHSGLIRLLKVGDVLPDSPIAGDGLISNRRGVLLGVQVADCVPVLVADQRTGAVGAFHAGWRGTVKRIVECGVGSMRAGFGCRPRDLYAAIGPCIHACCYSVGEEVVDAFTSQFVYGQELFSEVYNRDPVKDKYPLLFLTARAPGHSNIGPQTHLDLVAANRRQLLDSGISESRIWTAEQCTSCRTDLLFSHRAEAGCTGRMMGMVGFLD